jgi:hypothetical protein
MSNKNKPLSQFNKQKKIKISKKINKKIKAHNSQKNTESKLKSKKAELKTELETRLNDRGVEFRYDSALCAKYINGKTDLGIDYIVQRMCEMKYLYEYCDMKSIRAQVYVDYVNSGYIKDYEGTITTQAEKIALQTHSNGAYPNIFPWENNKIDKVNNFDDFDCQCGCQNIPIIFLGIFVSILSTVFIVYINNVIH